MNGTVKAPSNALTPQQRRAANIRRFLQRMFARKLVLIGAVGTLFFVIMAVFAPVIATHDPNFIENGQILLPPSAEHWFGTDMYGRDLFSRVVYGAQVSLLTGVVSTLAAAAIGSLLGMVAAFYGGIVDKILLRACEVLNSIPQLALSLTLIAIFGSSMFGMMVILCIGGIPPAIRMMRASALSVMSQDYILAAKLSGQKKIKLLYKHVFPNSLSPMIVMMTQSVGMTILIESGLSFLGVGIKIPTASWGSIINEARNYLAIAPLYVLLPCACLALLIISLNLLGDGVRDALDPSLRGEV